MMTDYRAEFTRKPETVTFDIKSFKPGKYRVSGTLAKEWWHSVCRELKVPEVGGGSVDLVLDVTPPVVRITGQIKTMFQRECVRSLEIFDDENNYTIDESLTWQEDGADERVLFHEGTDLDMGEYIRQQIILHFDLHPIKVDGERGGIIVSDGLDGIEDDIENPFAVLGQLKK